MAIGTYTADNGDALYRVYVNVRSKTNPTIRAQRRVAGIKSQREAEREEIRFIRDCEREVYDKESQGQSWGAVAQAFEDYLHSPRADAIQDSTRDDYVAAVRKHTGDWWRREAASITPLDVKELFTTL